MKARHFEEYRALRATIRQRGTARTWVFVAGLSAWAGLTLATAALVPLPLLSAAPLLVLAGSFEAIFALHIAVERIGRYLQVFHDDSWEHTAMSPDVPLAGTRTDPLFATYFGLATMCNFVPVLLSNPARAEWIPLGGAHLLFLVRIVVARQAAARQRPADLARFHRIKADQADRHL